MLTGLLSAGMGFMDSMQQNNMNMMNYKMNQKNLEWQKDMYRQQMGREDNAVQRRVADLRAAGLSPTLAAGSSASASGAPAIGKLDAPQIKMEPQAKLAASAALIQQSRNIANTVADTKLKEIQANQHSIIALRESEKLKQDMLNTEIQGHDWDIIKRQGIRSDSTGLAGQLSNLDAFTGGAASTVRDAVLPGIEKAKESLERVIRDSPLGSSEVSVPIDVVKSVLNPWGQLNKKTDAYNKQRNNSSYGRSK